MDRTVTALTGGERRRHPPTWSRSASLTPFAGASSSAATWLILSAWCRPALAQSAPSQPDTPAAPRPLTYGAEFSLGSGHADRGFVISDRPVVQPAVWIALHGAELSLWSSFTLAQTTEGSR